jgi:CheY-like chemotaxis protein
MRQKLLLADDSITVQRVIELTFADEGLDIATVGDGAQAIEHLRRDRADIVLADLNMPNVDGYAVAEHVKRTPDLVTTTRVVLLTGAFEPVDRDRAQKLGVDGILAKPFEPQVAIELVRQLLAQPPLSPPRTVTAVVAAVAVASPSDWTVDVSARSGSDPTASAGKQPAPGSEGRPPVAAGYPFEPGAPATARSTPAELDDYFKRLDEALASAGLKASPAVRDMLAESKEPANAASEAGAERARTSTAGGGTGGREFGVRDAQTGRPVGAEEERLMSGVPPRGPGKVTLVDAFSALLAAEQGDGSAEASLTAWEPASAASEERESGHGVSEHSEHSVHTEHSGGTFEAASAPDDAVEVAESEAHSQYSQYGSEDAVEVAEAVEIEEEEEAAAPMASAAVATATPAAVTPVTSAAPAAEPVAPAVSQEQLEAVVRKVLAEMTDRIVQEMRETVSNRVVDVAERLVREEIERLKAAAEADQA